MNKILTFFISVFLVASCANLEFTYKNNEKIENPIYKKAKVSFSGKELTYAYIAVSEIIGTPKETDYELFINIDETKTRRSVQNNQAVTKVDYKLNFDYKLFSIKESCHVYKKEVVSRFSYVPKSSGFNFGSDESLNNKYSLAVKNNLKDFIESLSIKNSLACINES